MNESMHSRLVVSARCASVLLLLLACAGGARAECPSVDHAAKAIQHWKQPFEIRRVVPSADAGICEAHVKGQLGGNQVLYMDAAGAHMFAGPIMEVATGRNLTEETKDSLNVSPSSPPALCGAPSSIPDDVIALRRSPIAREPSSAFHVNDRASRRCV